MAAELIPFGEYAYGAGGEFERECSSSLRDGLPDGYVLVTNVLLPRADGGFYECDAVIAAPGICDVLEMKCLRPEVLVGEDSIVTSTGFTIDRPLSILDQKAKVLAARRLRSPFLTTGDHKSVKVKSQVVVPSSTRINYKIPVHGRAEPVQTLAATIQKYRNTAKATSTFANGTLQREVRCAWIAFRDASAPEKRRTQRHLGRFAIRRQLSMERGIYEYAAVDEPPVRMDVRLREFPFDPALPARELERYLKEVAREAGILMKVRHPGIACVIGHFQTGCSWVEVSDWFDGKTLEQLWPLIEKMSVAEKSEIFLKVIQALEFCHERGVFHRNLTADSVWLSQDCSEIRLGRFECALDLSSTSTVTASIASKRDSRIIAPEDLQTGRSSNARLSDIFQAGVLLYRLLESGKWPFVDTLDYVTGGAHIREFSNSGCERETDEVRELASSMMSVAPGARPDLLSRVELELKRALA